jgi:hypothetical protein
MTAVDAMTAVEELRAWMAQERERSRAKLLAYGEHPAVIEALLKVGLEMHEAQLDCAARMLGEAPAVVVH